LAPAVLAEAEALLAEQALALLLLPAIGQAHVLSLLPPPGGEALGEALGRLGDALARVHAFYDAIGGLPGYQRRCLQMIAAGRASAAAAPAERGQGDGGVRFHLPRGPDLAGPEGRVLAAAAAAAGLEALPHMAEIYPLGGAGDRLGLQCDVTGDSVPTAMLPYCGRTLLEGLLRDLQAREYLYWRLNGTQHTTPVALMTSDAKDNHGRVQALLERLGYFGRGADAFRLFRQPLVPLVGAEDGRWLLPAPLTPMLKPGGHGAIWKLMHDQGVFAWLASCAREAALVRQISNPMAGMDATLLALSGTGYADGRSFGFASCERAVGAAEGINVLAERRQRRADGRGWEWAYNVANVEYTEFERLGVPDKAAAGSALSRFPANTNVLYVGLQAVEGAVRAGIAAGGGAALPAPVFNLKKRFDYRCALSGEHRSTIAGRMECTMQGLVDSLAQRFDAPLPEERHGQLNTFAVFNRRRKVTSSAKRRRKPGSTRVAQTPDGSFLDLMRNAEELLARCGMRTPKVGGVEEYLARGPGFLFLFHPALGPLWDVVSQKIRGGALAPGAELVLEVAEAALTDVRVEGSLLVSADCALGAMEAVPGADALSVAAPLPRPPPTGDLHVHHPDGRMQVLPELYSRDSGAGRRSATKPWAPGAAVAPDERLVFSDRCARVRLTGVVVRNAGVDYAAPGNCYWRHRVARREAARIVLHGQAEFEASHVVLSGDQTFEVPDGYRMVVSAGPGGVPRRALHPLRQRRPSWAWRYSMGARGAIRLSLEEPARLRSGSCRPSDAAQPAAAELPFSYVI
ncbi:hypothetical protein WJX81_006283, partial [Elliptochloris bilobata]